MLAVRILWRNTLRLCAGSHFARSDLPGACEIRAQHVFGRMFLYASLLLCGELCHAWRMTGARGFDRSMRPMLESQLERRL